MFSVLIPVHGKASPQHFDEALASLVVQVVHFNEVVVVQDGPIGAGLLAVLDQYRGRLPLVDVALPVNMGVARALNAGLARCRSEWIFRFDADDFCVPERAKIQRRAIETHLVDVVGGQIQECETDTLRPLCRRIVPYDEAGIRRFIKRRNPFNHMTVCFRRALALRLGGYPDLHLKEDYALWVKCAAAGARLMNLPDILVYARAGREMAARRGGLRYIQSELALQQFLWQHGIKSLPESLADGAMRSAVFAMPARVRLWVFMRALRS